MKSEKRTLVTAGIPSLFLIFSVLVMVILGLLTYGTSRSDRSLSQQQIDQTSAYYDATEKATEAFVILKHLILPEDGTAEPVPLEEAAEEFAAQTAGLFYTDDPADLISSEDGTRTVTYEIPFSDSQCLHVEIAVDPDHEREPLHILVWETRSFGSWDPDTTQHLYQGNILED